MQTILLVEVQDIGDTIIASPCIRQIRKRFPNAVIHMMVQAKSLDMVKYNPNLDKVVGVDNITSYLKLIKVAIKCRKQKFDLVINFSPSVRNNVIAAFCGANIVSGYINDHYFLPTNYHDQPVEVRGHKDSDKFIWQKDEPLIVRAIKPAAPFSIDLSDCIDTELFLPEKSRKLADIFFAKHKISDYDVFVGLHPVCLNDYRNWPAEKFAELGDRLFEHYDNIRIWLIGTDDDKETLDYIISMMENKEGVISDTSLSLLQAASIIQRCDVLVGMDSCPSDISGALKIPTVHMHGPTSAHVTGPGGRKNFPVTSKVSCSPCGLNIPHCPHDKRCMREISVSEVFDATLQAIEKYKT
ncbi:MAG: glycosyltransferase family 9 protein [Deltaproteobacteria bacterium]|nr:glycosyltransferase family 9 protein [Deltaproteobacteria bacterium]